MVKILIQKKKKKKKRICSDLELIYNFGKLKSNEQNYIIFEKKNTLSN